MSAPQPYSLSNVDLALLLDEVMLPVVEACSLLNRADSFWAGFWCEKTGSELADYWNFQDDNQQRPKQAMDDLASELNNCFEGVDKEDEPTLSEELRKLFDACVILDNFRKDRADDI